MSPQHLKKVTSQGMEKKIPEALDGTTKTSKGDIMIGSFENMSVNSDEPRLYHLDKKVKVKHASVLSLDTYSNNTNSADSHMTNSSIYSKDLKAGDTSQLSISSKKHSAEILQSSQSSMFPEKHPAKVSQSPRSSMTPENYLAGPTTSPKEYSAETLADSSDHWLSEDESPGPPESETFHAPYRNSGPDLMTLHIFTGEMNGEKPIYVPVYRRNNRGKLFKLVQIQSGDWKYLKMKKLTDEEAEGLELSKAEVVVQSSKPKKAGGCRTLADFGLPETKRQGGWGWL